MAICSMLDGVLVFALLGRALATACLTIPHRSLLETGSSWNGCCAPESRYRPCFERWSAATLERRFHEIPQTPPTLGCKPLEPPPARPDQFRPASVRDCTHRPSGAGEVLQKATGSLACWIANFVDEVSC